MYWILGNENIDLYILGITIPRLPVSSTVWQGDSSPMKLSYLTDRFVKRGKMDGHCPNPLSLAGLDQWLNTLLSCLLMRQGWSGIGVVHRVQDFYLFEFSLLLLHVGGGSSYNQKKKFLTRTMSNLLVHKCFLSRYKEIGFLLIEVLEALLMLHSAL